MGNNILCNISVFDFLCLSLLVSQLLLEVDQNTSLQSLLNVSTAPKGRGMIGSFSPEDVSHRNAINVYLLIC